MFCRSVSFATTCWEKDWKLILLDPVYLRKLQIAYQQFAFLEKILIINNVSDLNQVRGAAQARIDDGTLTRYIIAEEIAPEMLPFFKLSQTDFLESADQGVAPTWVYYNALGPLSAIYAAKGEYLLYLTGDVRLDQPFDWITPSLKIMEQDSKYKVANPVWNEKWEEARRESYKKSWNFYYAKQGFSDQMFLIKRSDFLGPIYSEIRSDSHHYPRGGVFEKRVFSYMKNHGWERIIFRRGSYTHENV